MTNLCYNMLYDTSQWKTNLYDFLINAKTEIICFVHVAKISSKFKSHFADEKEYKFPFCNVGCENYKKFEYHVIQMINKIRIVIILD